MRFDQSFIYGIADITSKTSQNEIIRKKCFAPAELKIVNDV